MAVLTLPFTALAARRPSRAPATSIVEVRDHLDNTAAAQVPGLQYVVVDADGVRFAYAGGWADIGQRRVMTADTTMMAFSMTKPLTAVAVMQLVEAGCLGLADHLDDHLPDVAYAGHGITIRHLLTHTAGIPNPIPLRWIHLATEHAGFDEDAALRKVLADAPGLAAEPGTRYAYSNIGTWLLGKIIERASRQPYVDYMHAHVLDRLGASTRSLGYVIADPARHAGGYLARYSFTNLLKGFLTDSRFWGAYEGDWLRINDHLLDGPAFGGLVGTATAFASFLQDQLRPQSVLLGAAARQLLDQPQTTDRGDCIPMTLGWHLARTDDGVRYHYKEGGGGGFHSEMRRYPGHGVGTVVMVNATDFDSTRFLNRVDRAFLTQTHAGGDR